MERKREHGDACTGLHAKRMHLDVSAHDDDDDTSPDYQLLEQFRKEALYRCMREAQREVRRAHEHEVSLQSQIARLQHSVLLVNQFWDALAEQMQASPATEPTASMRAMVPLALTHTSEEQAAALQERRALLEHILSRTAPPAAADDETQKRCTQLAAELSAMQQAFETMQARLSESVEHVASITEKLQRAEKRLDRFQSASVHAVEHPGQEARKEPAPPEKRESTQEAPPSDTHANATAEALASVQQELEGVRDVAHARERALEAVRAELLEAKQSCAQWQRQAQHVPDDRIRHHPLYQAVHADMAYLHQELEHARTTLATCERENAEMREFRADFLHQTTTQANTHSEELQKQLRARDADIARLRGQRDELNAELLERRSRETVRFAHVDEAKSLLASKDERMAAMQAQVARLESELKALREASHVDAAPPGDVDVATLQRRLQAADASSAMLSDEVDRLSAAYDQLERQADSRVANVARLEDKILRLTTEKAKADNKYFAAMRAKDALDAEKRAWTRSAERQTKVIERYMDTERALQAQIQLAEKEVTALRKSVHTQATRLHEAERDTSVLRRRHAESERARHTAEASVAQHLQAASREQAACQHAEERAAALEREAGRLRRRVAETGGSRRPSSSEAEQYVEHLNSLLRCSSCKERYRDRIILRCLHTFCEACVSARIQTRQRKCPHCGLAFATSDVQVLYLQ